jgi:hypothetical protein
MRLEATKVLNFAEIKRKAVSGKYFGEDGAFFISGPA